MRRRSHWGWGYEDAVPDEKALRQAAPGIVGALGIGSSEPELPVALQDASLPAPRVEVPAALRAFASAGAHERATHAWGRSYCDVVRAFRGRFDHAPDLVARPRDEAEVEAALEWAGGAGAAVVSFGGGTSVVGGVTPDVGEGHTGTLSLDLGALDRVLELDETPP